MRVAQMRGMGVLTTLISMEEMTPRRLSVTKSPRHDAIGGAILSSTQDNQKAHEGTEGNA
jgi:hypothetical protein